MVVMARAAGWALGARQLKFAPRLHGTYWPIFLLIVPTAASNARVLAEIGRGSKGWGAPQDIRNGCGVCCASVNARSVQTGSCLLSRGAQSRGRVGRSHMQTQLETPQRRAPIVVRQIERELLKKMGAVAEGQG